MTADLVDYLRDKLAAANDPVCTKHGWVVAPFGTLRCCLRCGESEAMPQLKKRWVAPMEMIKHPWRTDDVPV